jgi:AmmeMemoRadiSam system protein A
MEHLSRHEGDVLLRIARGALGEVLRHERFVMPDDPFLYDPGASFVTLREGTELRGCIGSLVARRPLGIDVKKNALAAAFDDPRFAPLRASELSEVALEVTVLSALEPIACHSEEEALAALRPGIDGVVLRVGAFGGTFIPQMWGELPEPRSFLAHLKRKAGLRPDFWSPQVRLSRFTADVAHEPAYAR